MKATDLLKKQHREVKKLLKAAENSEDASERKQLVEQIVDALKMHTQIEEQIFYPAVRDVGTKKANELIDESFEEHHIVDLVIAELPDADFDDEKFCAKISVLAELVSNHIEEEEDEMFPMAERLGAPRLRELGDEMQAMAEGEQPVEAHLEEANV
jgi:hemerythrin-like domain-containing protein